MGRITTNFFNIKFLEFGKFLLRCYKITTTQRTFTYKFLSLGSLRPFCQIVNFLKFYVCERLRKCKFLICERLRKCNFFSVFAKDFANQKFTFAKEFANVLYLRKTSQITDPIQATSSQMQKVYLITLHSLNQLNRTTRYVVFLN